MLQHCQYLVSNADHGCLDNGLDLFDVVGCLAMIVDVLSGSLNLIANVVFDDVGCL